MCLLVYYTMTRDNLKKSQHKLYSSSYKISVLKTEDSSVLHRCNSDSPYLPYIFEYSYLDNYYLWFRGIKSSQYCANGSVIDRHW